MRFLADENVHSHIIRWLRDTNHDVVWATESLLGFSDELLLKFAIDEARIMLTSDLDFGELIYHKHLNASGVVLMRMDHLHISKRLERVQAVWSIVEANPSGKYIVITESKVRVRNLPRCDS